MKTRFFMKLCLFSLLVWCISSCKSDNGDSVRPIALECMYTHLTDMTNMLDTAKIGTSDGTFPLANAQNLQKAVEELQTGISKGMAGYFVLQYEIHKKRIQHRQYHSRCDGRSKIYENHDCIQWR